MSLISPAALLFDEVARLGSIRKAAEQLNISPSALNRRILNLEEEYGLKLFERLPRGVRLTAAGEVLIADIRRWKSDQEKSKVRLQELQGLRSGHVAVGLMECLAGDFARNIVAAIQSRYRQVTLDVHVGGTSDILEKIHASELDIAVCFNVADRPNIRKLMAIDVPAGIVVSAQHPLAGRSNVHLSECFTYPFVLPDASISARKMIDAALQSTLYQTVPSLVTNSTGLMKRLVEDGRHIAFLGAANVGEELAAGTLSFVRVAGRYPAQEELSLVVRASQAPGSAMSMVIELLKQELASFQLSGQQN